MPHMQIVPVGSYVFVLVLLLHIVYSETSAFVECIETPSVRLSIRMFTTTNVIKLGEYDAVPAKISYINVSFVLQVNTL